MFTFIEMSMLITHGYEKVEKFYRKIETLRNTFIKIVIKQQVEPETM